MRAVIAVAAGLMLPSATAETCKWRWASQTGSDNTELDEKYRAYSPGHRVAARGNFGAIIAGAEGIVEAVPRPGAELEHGAVARVRFGEHSIDVQPAMIRHLDDEKTLLHKDWARRLDVLHTALQHPSTRRGSSLQFAPGKVPTQDRTCVTEGQGWRDEHYGLMSNQYDVGEPIHDATLQQCIDICARRYEDEWMPSQKCFGFSRQRNISDDADGTCWMKNFIADTVGDWYSHDNWMTYVHRCPTRQVGCAWGIADDVSVAHIEQFADTKSVASSHDCLEMCQSLPDCVSASFNKNSMKCSFSKTKETAKIDHGEYVSFVCDRQGTDPDLDDSSVHPCDDVAMNACDHTYGQCVKRYHGTTLTKGYWCVCDNDYNETTTYDYTCVKGCEPPYHQHTCATWAAFNQTAWDSWIIAQQERNRWNVKKQEADANVATLQAQMTAAVQAVAANANSVTRKALSDVVVELAVAQEAKNVADEQYQQALSHETDAKEHYEAANLAKAHVDSGAHGPHRIFGTDGLFSRKATVLNVGIPWQALRVPKWARQCVSYEPPSASSRRSGTLAAVLHGLPQFHSSGSIAVKGAGAVCAGFAVVIAAAVGVAAVYAGLRTATQSVDAEQQLDEKTAEPVAEEPMTIDV